MLVRSHSASTPRHAILDAHHASHALVLPFGRSQHSYSSSVYGRNEADVDMPECADAGGIGQPWVSHALYNALSSPAVSASSGSTEVCPRACVRANMYFSSNTPRLISSTKTIALLVEESKASKRLDSGRRLSVLATMPAKRVLIADMPEFVSRANASRSVPYASREANFDSTVSTVGFA